MVAFVRVAPFGYILLHKVRSPWTLWASSVRESPSRSTRFFWYGLFFAWLCRVEGAAMEGADWRLENCDECSPEKVEEALSITTRQTGNSSKSATYNNNCFRKSERPNLPFELQCVYRSHHGLLLCCSLHISSWRRGPAVGLYFIEYNNNQHTARVGRKTASKLEARNRFQFLMDV